MARRPGVLSRFFINLKDSLFVAKQKHKFMGADQYGNKYFEKEGDGKHDLRASRYIKERRDLDPSYETPEVPVEWEAWLRGRRKDPPTEEEIQRNYVKMMQTKMRAAQLEQKHSGTESADFISEGQSIGADIKSNETRSAFPTYDEYESSPGEKYNKKGNKVQ